jgi:hypothetical protein
MVRCGPDGSRGHCGALIMRHHEWALLREIIEGTDRDSLPVAVMEYGARFAFPVDEVATVVASDARGRLAVAAIDTADDLRALLADIDDGSHNQDADRLRRCIERLDEGLS